MQDLIKLTDSLYEANNSLEKIGNELFSEIGETVKTFSILAKIAKGRTTTKLLADSVQGTPASITQKTKILEEKGLIIREAGKQDRRFSHFSLTPEGEQVLKKGYELYEQRAKEVYSGFNPQELRYFQNFVDKLQQNLN